MTAEARTETTEPAPISAEVRVFVRRPAGVVFDYFADLRNEPQDNRQVSGIAKTTTGPIGCGTVFAGEHVGLGAVFWRLAEYERPSHLMIEGAVGRGRYRWISDFDSAEGGTWMIGRMEWQPPASWRPLRWLLVPVLRWNANRSFRRMVEVLQTRTSEGAA